MRTSAEQCLMGERLRSNVAAGVGNRGRSREEECERESLCSVRERRGGVGRTGTGRKVSIATPARAMDLLPHIEGRI